MSRGFGDTSNSILVICTRRIGDVLLSLPAIKNLRTRYPQAKIDLLVFSGTQEIPAQTAYINHVIEIDERPSFIQHLMLFIKIFRRYKIAISLLPGDRPVIYSFAAAPMRIGCLVSSHKNGWKRKLLTRWVPYDNFNTHTLVMNSKITELLGIDRKIPIDLSFKFIVNAETNHTFFPKIAAYAVFHISPRFTYKQWNLSSWQVLARSLYSMTGLKVILTGGGDEEERNYAEELMQDMPRNTLNLVGGVGLGDLSRGLLGAAIYVGTDTAVTHLAAMLGTPTVALYGPTNPIKWGPWPKSFRDRGENSPWSLIGSGKIGNVHLIQGTNHCVPCMMEGCDRHQKSESKCLKELDPSRVVKVAMEMLAL